MKSYEYPVTGGWCNASIVCKTAPYLGIVGEVILANSRKRSQITDFPCLAKGQTIL